MGHSKREAGSEIMAQILITKNGIEKFPDVATRQMIAEAKGLDTNSLDLHSIPDSATPDQIGQAFKPLVDKAMGKTTLGEDVEIGTDNFINAIPRSVSELATGAGKLTIAGAEKTGLISPETKQRGQDFLGRIQDKVNDVYPVENGSFAGLVGGMVPYAVGGFGKAAVEAPEGVSAFMKFLSGAKTVAKSGAVNGALGAAGSEGAGGNPLTGLLAGGGIGAGIPLSGKIGSKIFPAIGGAELGIPSKAIQFAAKPGANDVLKVAAGRVKNDVTGTNFAKDLENIKFPEEEQLRTLLSNAPPIDKTTLWEAMEAAKPRKIGNTILQPDQQRAVDIINSKINALKGGVKEGVVTKTSPIIDQFGGEIKTSKYVSPIKNETAADALDIRRVLDAGIPFDDPAYSMVERALLAGRTDLKNQLIKVGGGAQSPFSKTMEDYSKKLTLLDEMKSKINSHTETGEGSKASKFLRSAASDKGGSGPLRDIVSGFQKHTGRDYLTPANEENMALYFANKNQPSGGKPSLLPPHLSWQDAAHLTAGSGLGYFTHSPILGGLLAASEGFRSPLGNVLATKISNSLGRGGSTIPAGLVSLPIQRKENKRALNLSRPSKFEN